jgi:ferredoxin-thioredoxin reductase catalytic subunit
MWRRRNADVKQRVVVRSDMAWVSDEMLAEVRRELAQFKAASGHQSAYAAAHLAGVVEALLDEADCDGDSTCPDHLVIGQA